MVDLSPNAVLASTGLRDSLSASPPARVADLSDAPGSPDAAWWEATAEPWSVRLGFPNPGALSGTQSISLLLRRGDTADLLSRISLYQNGTLVRQLTETVVSSTTGQIVTVQFNASEITNTAQIELLIEGLLSGPPLIYSIDFENDFASAAAVDAPSSSIITTGALAGSKSARVAGGTAGWGFQYSMGAARTEFYFKARCQVNVTTNPTANASPEWIKFGVGTNWQFILSHIIRADGTSGVAYFNTTTGNYTGSGTTQVPRNTPFDLEVYIKRDATAGRFVVRVNGTALHDFTGNTGTAGLDRINFLAQTATINGAAFSHVFDNVVGAVETWPVYGAGSAQAVSANGIISPMRVQSATGTLAIPTASAFTASGGTPTYSLVSPPTGVTINSTTGVVSLNTATRRVAPITVRATVGSSTADQSFNATVGARYGIAFPKSEIIDKTQTQLNDTFAKLQAMGVREFRTDMIWMDVQTTSAAVNWSSTTPAKYVTLANTAAAYGMDVIFCVHMTPSWARLSGANYNGPGTPSAYGAFCADVATQFTSGGRRLIGLEVWNEPNLSGPSTFWQYGRPASELAAMQIAAHAAVKALSGAAGQVLVGMGGLSAVPTTGGTSSFYYTAATEWLNALYAVSGWKAANDFFGIHPYTYPYPWNDGVSNNDGLEITLLLRNIAIAQGDGSKPWWFTEYGASTNAATSTVSNTAQRQMFWDLFDWSANPANAWATKFHWYSYQDRQPLTSTEREDGFGIILSDGTTEKLVPAAMRDVKVGA